MYKNLDIEPDELRGKDFEDTVFSSCRFLDVSLRFTSFKRCQFTSCDFSGAVLDSTSFSDCTFADSKMSYLNLSQATVKNCDFSNAVMVSCIFEKLKKGSKSERQRIDLQGCRFNKTDLRQTVFVLCDLTKVDFREANLEGAVFEKCRLGEADLSGANINGAGFDTSYIKKTVLNFDGFLQYGSSKGFVLSE